MQNCIKILLFLILNEAQHVSGDTSPIIRSLKLHKQPLVLHTWKVVGRAVIGRCQVAYTLPDNVQQKHVLDILLTVHLSIIYFSLFPT